ncbi:MAG: type II secretion system protein M [Spirochaetes bacterium]|nr:type II secretion system protein M [Spirochaetota bacterium]
MKQVFKNVSNREKILIFTAIFALVVFIVYQFVFVPLIGARDQYALEYGNLQGRVEGMESVARRYAEESAYLEGLVKSFEKKKSVSVLTFLENAAEKAGIRDNIEYIKPKGNETKNGITRMVVELKVDAVSIVDLVRFLYRIEEDRQGLVVSYLRIKPYFKDRSKSDVIFRIADVTLE